MRQLKQIRVVKPEEKRRAQKQQQQPSATNPRHDARDVKDVVSGWVSEHRRRSEEFRRNYSTLLGQLGLSAPRGTRTA